MDWKSIIESDGLNIELLQSAKAKRVFPNRRAWPKDHPKIGAIIAYRSDLDCALGKRALDLVRKAKAAGRIDGAFIVVLGAAGEFIRALPLELEQVEAIVESGMMLREGKFGPFWWIPCDTPHEDAVPWDVAEDEEAM